MKLNQLLNNCNVTSTGFKAFQGLGGLSNKSGAQVVLSTNSPALLFESGITSYYAPVIPRNSRFEKAQEVVDADLDVNLVTVLDCTGLAFANPIIVSRHKDTSNVLLEMYPDAEVYDGDVTSQDIEGKFVIGTLPPHLIKECKAYQAVIVRDHDYALEGEVSGTELQERMVICTPISVQIWD